MIHKYYSTILKKKSIQFLFQGFKKPYKKMYFNDLKTFSITFIKKKIAKAMVIIFCDSRANLEKIFDRKYGKVFIYGNITYLTTEAKKKNLSCFFATALKYIVVVLKNLTIIILGHFNCGEIKAYLESYLGLDKRNSALPSVKKRLKISKIYFLKKPLIIDINLVVIYIEIAALIESLKNLSAYSILQERIKNKKLIIISYLLNIKNGELFS